MGNDMFNDEQLAKDRALKAEAALSALSRARETDGAVREAAEIVRKRLDNTVWALEYDEHAPGLVSDVEDLLRALSSPPRPGAEAPITCEEVGCPTCCPSPSAETKDDDKGGAA